MVNSKLFKATAILFLLVLCVVILVYAKAFLIPLTLGALLAMLLLPISVWLQQKGINKAIATILSILVLVSFFALIIGFVAWQISDITKDASAIEQQVSEKYQTVRDYITQQLGIPPEKQKQIIKEQQASSSGKLSAFVTGVVTGLGALLADTLLVLIYIFLFIYFRAHLKRFIIRIVKKEDEHTTRDIIGRAQKVTQKYLMGLSLMIMTLWIMYGVGFTIAGVKNAVFFAILCGVLEIVPFIGNLLGTALTITMSLVQGGETNVIIGILITYALVQFIQTYIIEPLVVGAEVNINPMFTIIGLIAGEMVWGIPGMILAIPLLGVAKIICDHVEPLKPFGELIGEDKKKKQNPLKKIKGWFAK